MSSMSLFGDVEHINTHTHLEGESFTAMFGRLTVDLTRQRLSSGDHAIGAYALFGQVTIRVPNDAGIHVDGSAIMGQTGYEWRSEDNELHSPVGLPEIEFETAPVRLRITAVAMFGEVKIVRVVTGERTAPALSVEPLPEMSSNAGSYEGETRRIASL
jgi:predicted membrane protein